MKFLSEVRATDLNSVGSKAAYLGDLMAAGFNVPPGFVIASGEDISDKGLIHSFFDKLGSDFVAVRTSPLPHPPNNTECTAELDSENWVQKRGLIQAINACFDSAEYRHAKYYMQRYGLSKISVAILVQQMVDVISSGVVFTQTAQNKDEMEVHACYGSGEYVSIGKTDPDRYVIDKSTKEVIKKEVNKQNIMSLRAGATQVKPKDTSKPKLTPKQISEVIDTAEKVVSHFGSPQDIEFAFDSKGIWILQARPLLF